MSDSFTIPEVAEGFRKLMAEKDAEIEYLKSTNKRQEEYAHTLLTEIQMLKEDFSALNNQIVEMELE